MQCPKDKQVDLVDGQLIKQLAAHHCPECGGAWITGASYETWQQHQPPAKDLSMLIDHALEADCARSPFDTRAALCPECTAYLSRAKVSVKTPFYVERCPNCKGIWCDRGEWDMLQALELHTVIDQLFSNDWQTRTREREQLAQERRATIDKLGPELAERVFALAEVLEKHPNGDFGVAYLMRRFDK
ncbi:MAG: zf-TFIIB domain-containing protein [Stenomitos rutilans HA7619-LM2]|nr:zf-TFIIB domain-containing protein [Stenomitos rutilans HA7619-LM2]